MIVEGPVLVSSPEMAWRMWRLLEPALIRVRDSGAAVDPDFAVHLGELRRVAAAAIPSGKTTRATETTAGSCDGWTITTMSTAEVAQVLGTTTSNVTARARRGSLPGWQVGRLWVFDAAGIERELAS